MNYRPLGSYLQFKIVLLKWLKLPFSQCSHSVATHFNSFPCTKHYLFFFFLQNLPRKWKPSWKQVSIKADVMGCCNASYRESLCLLTFWQNGSTSKVCSLAVSSSCLRCIRGWTDNFHWIALILKKTASFLWIPGGFMGVDLQWTSEIMISLEL